MRAAVFLSFFANLVIGQEYGQEVSGVALGIRFESPMLFFSLRNGSAAALQFPSMGSIFDFKLTIVEGRTVVSPTEWGNAVLKNREGSMKRIEIPSGQSFESSLDLSKFYDLDPSKSYFVTATTFVTMNGSRSQVFSGNLQIRGFHGSQTEAPYTYSNGTLVSFVGSPPKSMSDEKPVSSMATNKAAKRPSNELSSPSQKNSEPRISKRTFGGIAIALVLLIGGLAVVWMRSASR